MLATGDFFSSRTLTDRRLVFLLAHQARDEEDRVREQIKRDAFLLLTGLMLERGKEEPKKALIRSLQAQLSDAPPPDVDDPEADLRLQKAMMCEANEYWTGADPDAGEEIFPEDDLPDDCPPPLPFDPDSDEEPDE